MTYAQLVSHAQRLSLDTAQFVRHGYCYAILPHVMIWILTGLGAILTADCTA